MEEALKLALEALTYLYAETTAYEDDVIDKAITAIKEALAQPEQEPVATSAANHVAGEIGFCKFHIAVPNGTKLYTTPQQRPWVGLTEDERSELVTLHHKWNEYGQAIEAKLKEKNT